MKTIKTALRLACCLLAVLPVAQSASAQVFRRITSDTDIEVGARYLLVSPVYNDPSSVYVVTRQEQTGLKPTYRAAKQFGLDEHDRIHVENADIAMFELKQEGKSYMFRDTHNGGYLVYIRGNKGEDKADLYTLTDEEIDSLSLLNPNEKYYKTFDFDFTLENTCIVTSHKIKGTTTTEVYFYLQPTPNIATGFRLYMRTSKSSTLYLYKEVLPPTVENEAGDWIFRGDWLAGELSELDFSDALRIDFTGIELPQQWRDAGLPAGALPRRWVWTYVRQGEGGRLPAGWPNVIEVYPTGGEVPGRAVTAVEGGDSCVLPPKYAFRTATGLGISWRRGITGDGGWQTAGLPFDVQALTCEGRGDEPLAVERRSFVEMAEQGAVFRAVADDEPWLAGVPCLWRPVSPLTDTVCFRADDVLVQAGGTDFPATAGFYAACMRYELTDGPRPVYLLDSDGRAFVRAAAGSWIAPGRAFLLLPDGSAASLRILMPRDATGINAALAADAAAEPLPLYTSAGICVGRWTAGTPLPAWLPPGLYFTPRGKVVKR